MSVPTLRRAATTTGFAATRSSLATTFPPPNRRPNAAPTADPSSTTTRRLRPPIAAIPVHLRLCHRYRRRCHSKGQPGRRPFPLLHHRITTSTANPRPSLHSPPPFAVCHRCQPLHVASSLPSAPPYRTAPRPPLRRLQSLSELRPLRSRSHRFSVALPSSPEAIGPPSASPSRGAAASLRRPLPSSPCLSIPLFRKIAVMRKRVRKIILKKQGKSHIPLEHFDPNLQMFYRLQINMHVLLITWDQGLPICLLVPYYLIPVLCQPWDG
ncbi:uncharacterized protein LOC127780211 [Oryza glaberrima]|uniref:uncharacterized protein LOC127780211 n=1 Tax=Oryza glaberrima TaxID=4538 RepID=UPI00224C3702|nr:uncharacterized protein LOC127780211 [Oryza glaberrima]